MRLIGEILDLGINYIDTAPAYGVSEERVGKAVAGRRDSVVISTKVGEHFASGHSTHDFSSGAIRQSVERSAKRLGVDVLDIVFIHAPRDDMKVLEESDAVPTLLALKNAGIVRAIGFSGKTVAAARAAIDWADALMIEFHGEDTSHAGVIVEAAASGVGIVVKKGLASGRLDPEAATNFVLGTPGVSSMVVGSLNIAHMRDNVRYAEGVRT
jgi:aryl-alcohol dehydrogenase-like predicted oxidoreductase